MPESTVAAAVRIKFLTTKMSAKKPKKSNLRTPKKLPRKQPAPPPFEIEWTVWPEHPKDLLYDGVEYRDLHRQKGDYVVAFICGYSSWLWRPLEAPVQGFHIVPDAITTAEDLAVFKSLIEDNVRRRVQHFWPGRMMPGSDRLAATSHNFG
jgi:hypothetical protein